MDHEGDHLLPADVKPAIARPRESLEAQDFLPGELPPAQEPRQRIRFGEGARVSADV